MAKLIKDERVLREYLRLRNKGWLCKNALSAAKTRVAFESLKDRELVKLEVECDFVQYDDSYLDGMYRSKKKEDADRKALWDRIEREGVYGVVGYYRPNTEASWESADSVWGFIGYDWQDSGSDTDIMSATMQALEDAFQAEANELSERATYAGI